MYIVLFVCGIALHGICFQPVIIEAMKIESIGNYSSESMIWAVGVTDLEFQLLPYTSCEADCLETWTLMGYDSILTVSIFQALKYCAYSGNQQQNNATDSDVATFVYPQSLPKFRIDCFFMQSNITSVYHILTSMEVGSYFLNVLSNDIKPEKIRSLNKTLVFRYCPELSPPHEDFLKISNSSNARFNETVSYTCTGNSRLIVDNNFAAPCDVYTRKCGYTACWTGANKFTCSYAPSTSVRSYNKKNATTTFVTNEVITLYCDVNNFGNPNATGLRYLVTTADGILYRNCSKELNEADTFQVIPKLDKARVTCQGINKYTLHINTTSGIAPPSVLNVQFGPMTEYEQYHYDALTSSVGHSAVVSFNFTANPDILATNLVFTFSANGTGMNTTRQGVLCKKDSLQIYEYTIASVTPQDFGLYYLSVSSSNSLFDPLVLTRNLTGEVLIEVTTYTLDQYTSGDATGSTASQVGLPIVTIIAPVVGLVVIILIGMLAYMMCQRKKRKKSVVKEERENPVYEASSIDAVTEREERLNPLYGSSPGASQNEKENRINPLYGSAGSLDVDKKKEKNAKITEKPEMKNPPHAPPGKDVVEDAYAEIEKNKVKKKVASRGNALFSVEPSGDTYAEVKKPNKENPVNIQSDATYAEVQKNKGSKKDGGLHGTVSEAP